ncbi:cation transport protein-domain-containing protein [Penicillium malachiteum]|uniref:Cation transport protein-domain-containing protein n=1 Tax=Penicillium malachiteum TaxID=1324776 RepID=A0AAD6HBY3_9EURO|nr:cation transport protein-domain-containing protein [Penicillium malachiteum]
MAGVGARPDLNNHSRDAAPVHMYADETSKSKFGGILRGTQKYFASTGLVSRNSQFHGLTSAEREKLGGVEYKAVSFLSVVVALYLILFLLLGTIGVGTWLQVNHPEVATENGLSPYWTGSFFAVSAFVNIGMALLDKNMTALQLK